MRRGFVIFLFTAFVSLVVVAYSQKPPEVIKPPQAVVPSLEGQELAAAREKVGDDFELVSSYENSDQPEGTVIVQNPGPGTKAERGASISVVVSDGPEKVQLPDVVGKVRDEAEGDLSDAGFKVEVKTEESQEAGVGKVLEQSPSAGAVKKGSEVVITVGQAPKPAPGYVLVEDPNGALTVEVPTDWTVLKGSESEDPPGMEVRSWSKFLDEDISSSITAAADIEGFETGGVRESGIYVVASKTLAQKYSEEEAIYNAVHNVSDPPTPNLDDNCEAGPIEGLGRPNWSGKVQTWHNCRGLGITNFLIAATPGGGGCMVFMTFKMASETDRDTKEHILNTFEVDCGNIEPIPEPTPEPTTEPTPEPTTEPTPEPTTEPTPEPTPEPTSEQYARVDPMTNRAAAEGSREAEHSLLG